MKKIVAIIILCAGLTGCATTARLDKRGMEYESKPPQDAGLTLRTVAIEGTKLALSFVAAYFGAQQ